MTAELQRLFLEFFTNLGIEIESFSVKEEDGKNIYRAILQTPDSKVLIGIHGKTLEALAHILGRMAEKKFEKKILIHLEVNDYLQAKEERLHQYIEKKISESQEKNEHTPLPSLTSYERKLVHAYIQEKNIPGLIAQSTGEGQERTLSIYCPKIHHPKTHLNEDGIGI